MDELHRVNYLLSRRCFVESAYFGCVNALKSPNAEAHMLAGVGCCGCARPLAITQRLLEGAFVPDAEVSVATLLVSPETNLPYEGFFHLIEAVRRDPAIMAPENLREVFDSVADDLAYVSRRELHHAPDERRRYTHRMASLSAAVLLRRLTGNGGDLPGVASPSLEEAARIIEEELNRTGGDAAFY